MPGIIHIPWYATGFRGDRLEAALADVTPIALRYGATSHALYRYQDDRYKFLQMAGFERYEQWERYWNGVEFSQWRAAYTTWYQVPVLYVWQDVIAEGRSEVQEGIEQIA